jgi:hypothetical protein
MRDLLTGLLIASGTEEALAVWVPVPVLISAVFLLSGLVVWLVKLLLAKSEEAQERRDAIVTKRIESLDSTLRALGDQSHAYVRIEAMGRMGNRFDERISDLRERVKVIESDDVSFRERLKEIESTLRRRERE